jgi:ketosteroid isomerase-like protein
MVTYRLEATVSTEVEAGLRAYREREREAYNASDLGMVDNFCSDVILASHGLATMNGREEIRTFFEKLWAEHHASMEEVVDETVHEAGNLLIITGRFRLKITVKASGEVTYDNGRMVVVLKRNAAGDYELFREAALDNPAT